LFSTQNKRKTSTRNELQESLNNEVEINNTHQTPFTNIPSALHRQQNGIYSSYASYGSNTIGIMNNSYEQRLHQGQQNGYFVNYHTCYKCNNMIVYNMGQFYQCISCTRLCCFTCSNPNSIPSSCYYRCEYCSLQSALQATRCL
jgi:hypothetical protein